MENPLYIGLSRQVALRRHLEVVANNIANMNTVGFRADRMLFEAAMERVGGRRSEQAAFTIDRATYTDMRPGSLRETGRALDLAIEGDGWIAVGTDEGVRYTRDARLNRAEDGRLVTLGGHAVLDDGGQPIQVPPDAETIVIGPDGTVTVDGDPLGRIGLVRFEDQQGMRRGAQGLHATDEPPQPADGARLAQGKVEAANVQPIVEITRMMELSRDYQAVSRMVEEGHELLRSAIGRLGKATQGT
jgi:flagellar basal-body rod protein FlgF